MDSAKQRDIASKGGKAAHAKGRAHEWTVDEARQAGRKGGAASHRHDASRQPLAEGAEAPDEPALESQPPDGDGHHAT